jgi:hypothetical protein
MDKAPLVIDEIEAGAAFVKRMDEYEPVKAAYWLRSDEEGERYLHVAIEGLDEYKTDRLYGEVRRITGDMKDQYLDPFRVKVVSTNDPIAKAVMDIYRRFPDRAPPRFTGAVLGGVAVAEVYIYPQLPQRQ